MVDWNTLIDEHGSMVVRISWRILGHAADVEDNVQEVFLEAYRLQTKETIRHWRGLLRRLATLKALDKLRRRRHELSLTEVALLDPGGLPEDDAICRESELRLRKAVALLSQREGAVFSLRYFEGLELAEIATSLGISYSAAGAALCRARGKLEGLVAETVVEEE